jgi:hypothetical protein
MPEPFKLTPRQQQALRLLGDQQVRHFLLYGGSRSAKTFLHLRTIATRAVAAPVSRHAVFRFRMSHLKASVIADTWPKMMSLCFPNIGYELDKQDFFAELPNRSQIWFAGLDDKERTEKVLGQEYATILLNEVSQIPWASRNMAITRLAQKCTYQGADGAEAVLRLLALYDCNPPRKTHWSNQLFIAKRDPETKQLLEDPGRYAALQMNPMHNLDNLSVDYLEELRRLPARLRVRFLDGQFNDDSENSLWTPELIERWRQTEVPELQRIVVGVDPSGAGDEDNAGNDEIGIVVAGLGTDGNAYVLEDLTLKAGPERWGGVAVSGYDRHDADVIVGETNFGGDMVRFVVQAAGSKPDRKDKPKPVFKKITASRGKAVRAEPVSVLTEQGKIRFVGRFDELEEELCDFMTTGYVGGRSPNRADALVWAISELFPGIVRKRNQEKPKDEESDLEYQTPGPGGWMG